MACASTQAANSNALRAHDQLTYVFKRNGIFYESRLSRGTLVVLPASDQVDLSLLKAATRAKTVALAGETEFKDRFPGCETGAMPPFGNLYGMPVFADESLAKDKEIAFNAGTHSELIRFSWEDFVRLVKPRVLKFSSARTGTTAA